MLFRTTKSAVKSAFRAIRRDPEVRKVINRFPRFFKFVKKRLTPDEKFGLYLTIGIIISAVFIYLFLNILLGLFTQDLLVMSDLRVINIAVTYRTPALNHFMFFITTLGSGAVVFIGAFALAIFFYLTNRWRYLISILSSVVFGELFYRIVKNIIERPRPSVSLALVQADGYSFPSGHAFMAMTFYGMLFYFLYRQIGGSRIQRKKLTEALLLTLSIFFIGLIGYSRIYLGVHWPTDVLAGWAAGAAWVTVFITVLEIRRKFRKNRKNNFFPLDVIHDKKTRVAGLVLLIVWILFTGYYWKREADTAFANNSYAFNQEEKIHISRENIPDRIFEKLPRVSETISGKPQEPIHIIILGSEKRLKSVFLQAGWLECDRLNTKNLRRLAVASLFNESYPAAPGVPSLWNALPNDFSFERPTENNSARERHHIHFWKTPYYVDEDKEVWLATAHYDTTIKMNKTIIPVHSIDPAIDKEREEIKKELVDTGRVDSVSEFQIVDPTLGKNQSGDLFFTDGKAYVFDLK